LKCFGSFTRNNRLIIEYFSSGKQIPVFKLHDFSVAVFICNDLWHPSLPYLGVCQKADIFVSIFNSSQGSMGSEFSNIESWEIITKFYARVFGIYVICASRVGKESLNSWEIQVPEAVRGLFSNDPGTVSIQKQEYRFWGGSEIINPYGQHVAKAAMHEPDEIIGEISRDLLRQKRILLPYLRNDDPYFTHRQLDRILYE